MKWDDPRTVATEGDESHGDLSWVLNPEEERFPGWSAGETEEILRHQLETFLAIDVGGPLLELDRVLVHSGRFEGLRGLRFSDLLFHPRPPVEALRLVKDYAKQRRHDPEALLPADVATILYYGSICAAYLRCGVRISSLGAGELRMGVDWALCRQWVTGPIRSLLEEARRSLEREAAAEP